MNDMQAIILQSANKIFLKHMTKDAVDQAENGHFLTDLWADLQESGLLLIGIEEEDGGNGGDLADGFKLMQLAGKYSAPIPLAETLIGNWLLAETGLGTSAEMKSLPSLYAPDENHFSFESGFLSGMVPYIPYGREANQVMAFMQQGQELELVLLPLQAAKVKTGKNLAGEARDTLIFGKLSIKELEHCPIGPELRERMNCLGALARVAMMTGAMERIMELTLEHVQTRHQFGKPLSHQQAIQQHIALLAGELAAAKAALNNAVVSLESGHPTRDIALAKIRVNEGAGKFAKAAHQIMAAIGFTHEHSLHQSTRRLWSYRDEFGSEADWSEVIANQLRQRDKNGLWEYITGQHTPKGEKNERLTIYR